MPDKVCPLVGGACLRDGCAWWVHVTGKTPQENKEVDLHDCAIAWIPILTLETTKAVRATGDVVEAFRSETRKAGESLVGLMFRAAHRPPPAITEPANGAGRRLPAKRSNS